MPQNTSSTTWRTLELAKGEKRLLTLGFITLCAASLINLSFPYIIRIVLNEQYGVSLAEDLNNIIVGIIVLFAVQAVFFYWRHYYFYIAGYKIVKNLRDKLFRAILKQDISFFDHAKVGDLLSRLSADTEAVQRALTVNISVAIRYLLQVIGGTAMMLWLSPLLSGLLIISIPVLVFLSIFWGKKLKQLSKLLQLYLAEAAVSSEEAISGAKTVKLYSLTQHEATYHESFLAKALKTGDARTKVAALFSSAMVFLLHSTIALTLWFGVIQVKSGALSAGDVTSFLLYGVIVAVSFGFLAGTWDEFMKAVGAAERIFEILDIEPSVTGKKILLTEPSTAKDIVFENVSFAYPARPDENVLKNISFTAKEGQTVALVGPSGAGKTTICHLIPRFYDPTAGQITYAGINIAELSPDSLRLPMSMVMQEPQIFSCSVADNVRFGKLSATKDEVVKACETANLASFIDSLPQGYDTLVGDKGVLLSGGQKQRIAIARAVLKNPKVLILDEATSALDSENEHLIQKALDSLMKGRTTIVVAHRLSTVKNADLILVLKDGEIVQRGTHEELIKDHGVYKGLVDLQMFE